MRRMSWTWGIAGDEKKSIEKKVFWEVCRIAYNVSVTNNIPECSFLWQGGRPVKDNSSKKTDKRAYTLMIIPHRGAKTYSLRLPMLTIKRLIAGFVCCFLVVFGLHFRHMLVVWKAQNEQAELARLRETQASQEEKLNALTKITEEMQYEMGRVTQLEGEVRRSFGVEGGGVSRSGALRAGHAPRLAASGASGADELIVTAGQIKEFALHKQAALTSLSERLVERNRQRAATPSIWPASGEVTSRFGYRRSPSGVGSNFHKGLDIAGAHGSPVYATADGIVNIASYYYGFGRYVLIDHGYGLKTAYGHNSMLLVQAGQQVKKGQVIAYMGSSGVSTGTHVHYEVIRYGEPVNPEKFL